MKLIILRHAESESNVKKKISSKIPGLDLSAEGVNQSLEAGKDLNQKYVFDHIYSSPFLRTLKTAEYVNQSLKKDYVIPDIRIGEMFFGLYDDKVQAEMDSEMQKYLETINQDNYSMRIGTFGESEYSLRDRLLSFLIELGIRHKNETILVVTHQTPGGILQEMANNYTGHISLKNACYAEVELTDERVLKLMEERNNLYKYLKDYLQK